MKVDCRGRDCSRNHGGSGGCCNHGGRGGHQFLHVCNDLTERGERRHVGRVYVGHAGCTLLNRRQNLHPLDGVNPKVALQVHLQGQHLRRIAGLVCHDVEHQCMKVDCRGRDCSWNHWNGNGGHDHWSGDHWSGDHWSGDHWSGDHWSGDHWSGHSSWSAQERLCSTRQTRQRRDAGLHGLQIRTVRLCHRLLECSMGRRTLLKCFAPCAQETFSRRVGLSKGHRALHGRHCRHTHRCDGLGIVRLNDWGDCLSCLRCLKHR